MTGMVLRGVRLLDPAAGTDSTRDVLITDGVIAAVEVSLPAGIDAGIIDCRSLWAFPGLVDMHVHLRVPGDGRSETMGSALRAAVAGGVTRLAAMPNTSPPVDTPELVRSLAAESAAAGLCRVLPVACVTRGRAGLELADLDSLRAAGAVAFSDDGSSVRDSSILLSALRMSAVLGCPVIQHPEDPALSAGAPVNLGRVSEALGLRGSPECAETADIARSAEIALWSGGRLHLTHVSTPRGLSLVHSAASSGALVTCDVTPHHLALDESEVLSVGPAAKMNPPLRSSDSRTGLVRMTSSGWADAVASDHAPHHEGLKNLPLEKAASGITGLETLLPLTLEILCGEGGMSPLAALGLLSRGPAEVLGIPFPGVRPGSPADLVLFDPAAVYSLSETGTFSMSRNTPFLSRKLTGRVRSVWIGEMVYRDGVFA
jgi:dihydroorotase